MKRFFFSAAFLLGATPALASSPVSFVGTAKVNEGAQSLEARAGFTTDHSGSSVHERLKLREHYDYGFNDWYALRVVLEQDKRRSEDIEHEDVTIENRFQIFEKREHGWDGGIRLIYVHADGDKTPHEIDVRLMAMVPFEEKWEYRHNMVWEHDVGPDSENGLMLELRHQLTRAIDAPPSYFKGLRAGIEMFNDFGRLRELSGYDDQGHQFGPVMKGRFENGYYFQAGYRAGLSEDAPDHLFKLAVGRKF